MRDSKGLLLFGFAAKWLESIVTRPAFCDKRRVLLAPCPWQRRALLPCHDTRFATSRSKADCRALSRHAASDKPHPQALCDPQTGTCRPLLRARAQCPTTAPLLPQKAPARPCSPRPPRPHAPASRCSRRGSPCAHSGQWTRPLRHNLRRRQPQLGGPPAQPHPTAQATAQLGRPRVRVRRRSGSVHLGRIRLRATAHFCHLCRGCACRLPSHAPGWLVGLYGEGVGADLA